MMSQLAPVHRPEGALRALGTVRHFAPDQAIYHEGDPVRELIQVLEGMVRSTSHLSDGRRYIDAFHIQGQVFGFESGAYYTRSAEAVCKCAAVFYPLRNLAAPGAAREVLSRQILDAVMQGLAQARDHAKLLGRATALEKIAAFLLACPAQGDMILLPMTRQDIADYLGLTMETVCRGLAQFKQNGVIDIQSARCIRIVDHAALKAMTG
jgi:CRP/FNR family nitrogen fixation transcriptional regulator